MALTTRIIKLQKVLLADLLKEVKLDEPLHFLQKNIFINNLRDDSRKVERGDLFIAIPCPQVIENVSEAMRNGATVILSTSSVSTFFLNQKMASALFIKHSNPRLALSLIAKTFYKIQPDTLLAVTGTNGKSSVVNMVLQLWTLLGKKSACFGTLGLQTNKKLKSIQKLPSLTTYDSLSFFQLLKDLANADIQHVIFEASSIGLDQFRIYGSQITVAGFTNLTQDHLDYHQDMEDYFLAKQKLFTEVLKPKGIAVLNANAAYFERLKETIEDRGTKVLTYGINKEATIYASNIRARKTHIAFDIHYANQIHLNVSLNLCGTFQVENILCATAMLIATGIEANKIINLIPNIKPIKGRMELVGETQKGAAVYVDYAHTPHALERALKSLREYTEKSIWVVFGCGGDRDAFKRPQMGKISSVLADKIIITDDNPRSEDAVSIRKQILKECKFESLEIADRREAIDYAIAHLEKGDTLLIAGKGHETGQIIGKTAYPFNDVEEAKKSLARLKA